MTQAPFQVNQTPSDLVGPTSFEGVLIPLTRLMEERLAAGAELKSLTFRRCVLRGPMVLVPNSETNFVRCNMGDALGDTRNLFLRAAGPAIIGAANVGGWLFEDCMFVAVGFAGNDRLVDFFLKQLSPGGAAA